MQGSTNYFKTQFKFSEAMTYSRCGPSLPQPFLKRNFPLLPPHTNKRSVDCQELLILFLIAWAEPEAEQTHARLTRTGSVHCHQFCCLIRGSASIFYF